MILRACLWLALGGAFVAGASDSVNVDAQLQKEFESRVKEYVKLHNTAREGLDKLKPTKSAGTIESHEERLAHRIRELRHGARQGDIFTTQISAEFRRLIEPVMQGPEAARIRESLKRAEPVHLRALQVNGTYPEGVPLQSTPPTLLLNLPKLPPEVEYRVVGRALVLRDLEANLIVDLIPDVLPEGRRAQ